MKHFSIRLILTVSPTKTNDLLFLFVFLLYHGAEDVLFSLIVFPNVSPLSLLALNSGINSPVLFVHQVTKTLLPEAAMSTFWFTMLPLLGALSMIVLPSVLPPSMLFVKNTPQ